MAVAQIPADEPGNEKEQSGRCRAEDSLILVTRTPEIQFDPDEDRSNHHADQGNELVVHEVNYSNMLSLFTSHILLKSNGVMEWSAHDRPPSLRDPELKLKETVWRVRTPSEQVITCGIYESSAPGLEVQAGYSHDAILHRQHVWTLEAARALCAQWLEDTRAQGFEELASSNAQEDLEAPPEGGPH